MDELCGRPAQGEERQTLRKVFESKLPRQVYLQNISSLSPEEVSSGCRDACPSKDVLKTIRQKVRSVPTPSHNEREALAEIREQQQEGCRHPMAGKPPLAVASHFTTSHNIPSVFYFIGSFCHAESLLYRNNKTLPKLVMCDGSMALIQSVIQPFFKKICTAIWIVAL